MPEEVQLRVHGDASLPTLVYLPGIHGDWTLIGSFLQALNGRVRFVEMTYPRTTRWSLYDYADAIETALSGVGITHGWLLGESFGSQPLWAMIRRGKFNADGIILAGGFVKYPIRRMILRAEYITQRLSNRVFIWIIFSYAKIARFRYRHSPEVLARLNEFIARRTEPDRRAAQHRLHLIAENDPAEIAANTSVPVYALSGFLDPIVPWLLTRRWLRKNCRSLRDFKVIGGDHNVLGTAPRAAARQVMAWMGVSLDIS
ncbi:MAG TPA: alpha/beta hydrolase [Verrucomicrobiae bacterium]